MTAERRYGGMPVGASGARRARTALPPYRPTVIIDRPRPGAENMALDAALLDEADRNGTVTLRLYRWDPPCLSFGRNEPALKRYDRDRIAQLGLDVVRRPTGGRAVWHEHEVTYAVAAPVAAFGALRESYCTIHQVLAAALRSLGADASLAPSQRAAAPLGAGACFASPVGGEVLIQGRKVVGSAQVRQGNAFLQHGSILLAGTQDIVSAVSRTPSAGLSGAAITLSEALGRSVEFDEVADAIVAAWEDRFGENRNRNRETSLPIPFPLPLSRFPDSSWTWRR